LGGAGAWNRKPCPDGLGGLCALKDEQLFARFVHRVKALV